MRARWAMPWRIEVEKIKGIACTKFASPCCEDHYRSCDVRWFYLPSKLKPPESSGQRWPWWWWFPEFLVVLLCGCVFVTRSRCYVRWDKSVGLIRIWIEPNLRRTWYYNKKIKNKRMVAGGCVEMSTPCTKFWEGGVQVWHKNWQAQIFGTGKNKLES